MNELPGRVKKLLGENTRSESTCLLRQKLQKQDSDGMEEPEPLSFSVVDLSLPEKELQKRFPGFPAIPALEFELCAGRPVTIMKILL